ncbi:MAG: hypothetical protein ABEJ87_01080 [Candidatus Nanohalobium sp.]
MKGQTQAVTAVLVTGIVVGGIGTAYLWGIPKLHKRQVKQDVSSTEHDVTNLYSEIVSISKQGSGASSTVTVKADNIKVNEKKDYIQITNKLDQPAKQGFTWSLLKGDSFQNTSIVNAGAYGIKGDEQPGIVAFKSSGGSGSSEITYRVEFRNLCLKNTHKLSKIDLQTAGQKRAAGSAKVKITNKGDQTDNRVAISQGACRGTPSRTNKVVQISFE